MAKRARLKPRFVHNLLEPRLYQDRPQLAAVCDWWRSTSTGICSLEGIGGAGKTAIAERFLRLLPGGYAASNSRKDLSLRPADAVFVYSYYDVKNHQRVTDPDLLFWALADWLLDKKSPLRPEGSRPPSAHTILDHLQEHDCVLIVIDGLEVAQEDASPGQQLGSIAHGELRELLDQVGTGRREGVRILTTTRFQIEDLYSFEPSSPLRDPRGYAPGSFYRQIKVEELTLEACVALLQEMEVKGSREVLARIAEECGFHALTVDFFGSFIVHMLDGDADKSEGLLNAAEMMEDAKITDRAGLYAKKQQERLGRVALQYHLELQRRHPQALELLQRLCALSVAASRRFLTVILGGTANPGIENDAQTTRELQIAASLQMLQDMHLIKATRDRLSGDERYAIHPAIRDSFLGLVHFDGKRGSEGKRAASLAALDRLPKVSLEQRPGEQFPTDPGALNDLESVLHLSIDAGFGEQALGIYLGRLGGYAHLGGTLGAYELGARVCAALGGPLEDLANYKLDLGEVSASLEVVTALARTWSPSEPMPRRDLLLAAYIASGRLAEACAAVNADRDRDTMTTSASAWLAYARALRGEVHEALKEFDRLLPAASWASGANTGEHRQAWNEPRLLHCMILAMATGHEDEAERGAQFIVSETEQESGSTGNRYSAAAHLILAQLALRRFDRTEVERHLAVAQTWAEAHGARQLVCQAWLLRARVAMSNPYLGHPYVALDPAAAVRAAESGLVIAAEAGLALEYIDLALELAKALLCIGDQVAASGWLRKARLGSFEELPTQPVPGDQRVRPDLPHPPAQQTFIGLLGAEDPRCGYAWGTASGLHLAGELELLAAARLAGRMRLDRIAMDGSTAEWSSGLKGAQQYIDAAMRLRSGMMDWRLDETRSLRARLMLGMLEPKVESWTHASSRKRKSPVQVASNRGRVFISYARSDDVESIPGRTWRERIARQFAGLLPVDDFEIWCDEQIVCGADWEADIQNRLTTACAAVLLIGPGFLASEYICKKELPILVSRARRESLPLIPVILRPCAFEEAEVRFPDPDHGPEAAPLTAFQSANSVQSPLDSLSDCDQEAVLLKVARSVAHLARAGATQRALR